MESIKSVKVISVASATNWISTLILEHLPDEAKDLMKKVTSGTLVYLLKETSLQNGV